MLINIFDPWKSKLCTCPKKYSFNPYTGCGHRCIYCYITSYIRNAFNPRVKKELIKRVRKEVKKIDRRLYISMSNSSDPYTTIDREYKLTRACLKIFKENDVRVLIVTKSDLFLRDLDIIGDMKASISVTITTLDEEIAEKLEPNASEPSRRLKALEKAVSRGIRVSCRIDPIIPFLNEDVEELVKELSCIGVEHVVSSTFKPRHDSWRRFKEKFPKIADRLEKFYFINGERVQNSYYLSREFRYRLMRKIRDLCKKYRMTFSTCREGFLKEAKSCDGSHLIL